MFKNTALYSNSQPNYLSNLFFIDVATNSSNVHSYESVTPAVCGNISMDDGTTRHLTTPVSYFDLTHFSLFVYAIVISVDAIFSSFFVESRSLDLPP